MNSLSLIIAFRNEESCLNDLLFSIANQSISNFNVILINDHSTDYSVNIFREFLYHYTGEISFHLLDATHHGKKKAIIQGVNFSSSDYLVFTDADCILPRDFIKNYLYSFIQSTDSFLLGPVLIQPPINKLIILFQYLEQVFIMASFKWTIFLGKSIGCSGANYGLHKAIFSENINVDVVSGDDMFQLLNAKNELEGIGFVNSIVYTKPQDTTKSFLQQRVRWYRKMVDVKDADIRLSSLFLTVIFLCIYSLLFIHLYVFLLSSIILFSISYFYLLKSYTLKSILSPLFVIFYPFYLLLIIIANKRMKLQWKNRDVGIKG